jgi:hypothetical protein
VFYYFIYLFFSVFLYFLYISFKKLLDTKNLNEENNEMTKIIENIYFFGLFLILKELHT